MSYSIVLIPDTQNLSASSTYIAHFQAAADWIVANKDTRNIELVLHLGDVVNSGGTTEFGRAQTPMETIWDSGIPFAAAIGNHDYDGGSPAADLSDTGNWNTYFGTGQYTGRSWWSGEFHTTGKSENFYFTLTLGGRPTLVLVLEFFCRSSVLSWAAGVIASNPQRDVIVTTHAYLTNDATLFEDSTTYGPNTYSLSDSSSGVEMWEAFKQYPNVIAVFNGHDIGGPAYTAELNSTGNEGNNVFQQFTNWQQVGQGGDGRIVILTVDPESGTATREVYNARTAAFESAYELTFQLYEVSGMNPSTFRSNLATQLNARPGINVINADIHRYPPGKKARTVPTLIFGVVQNVEQSDFTLVGNIQKIYTIQGGGYAPGAGSSDAQWATAESNAWTLIDELNNQLEDDETVNGACDHARVTSWTLTPSTDDQGRVFAEFEFTITVWKYPA